MREASYYRASILEKEVIFDFSSNVETATREELRSFFTAHLEKLQAQQYRTPVDEIVIRFFNDSLSKINAGYQLCSVMYSK